MSSEGRLAVVLFNLGGPDRPEAVRPFLRNLFSDPAIIAAPGFVRAPLAGLIAHSRERGAQASYALIGGASPLLAATLAQATALEDALSRRRPEREVKVMTAMRYWPPLAEEAARAVESFSPDRLVLAPIYPQFSTTTTASSLDAWRREYRGVGQVATLCCWEVNDGLVQAHADLVRSTWEQAGRPKVRLLFSAHGVPQSAIRRGDPYQWQIERTCAAIAARLEVNLEWRVCYQSKVGPTRWLGPSTVEEIQAAAREGLGVLIDPVAFVSDHVETLVEIDHDYRRLAGAAGVKDFLRCPAVGVHPAFIGGLADAVDRAAGRVGVGPDAEPCPGAFTACGARRSQA